MRRRRTATAVLAVMSLIGATDFGGTMPVPDRPPGAASVPPPRSEGDWPDVHSYADAEAFRTHHIDLDLEIDFDRRELRGTATLDIERLDRNATELVLDTRDLRITAVETASGRDVRLAPTRFELGPRHEVLGRPLRIAMPAEARRIRIHYATSPQASGLHWLDPVQTAGKRLPFLYSQAQSIHARSFIPLQDTPRIRATCTATLRVPRGLTAVMVAAGPAAARAGRSVLPGSSRPVTGSARPR